MLKVQFDEVGASVELKGRVEWRALLVILKTLVSILITAGILSQSHALVAFFEAVLRALGQGIH